MNRTRVIGAAIVVVVATAIGLERGHRIDREAPRRAEPLESPDRRAEGSRSAVPAATTHSGASPVPGEEPTRLLRTDVYRSIAEQPGIVEAQAIAQSLLDLLLREAGGTLAGSSGVDGAIALVEKDLEDALDRNDTELVAGSSLVLAVAARGPEALLDDRRLLSWLDAIALSELAANAVLLIFDSAQRFTDEHFLRLIEIVRDGLPEDRRRECARRLFRLHFSLHDDPEPYLELLADADPFLRSIAVEALLALDADRHRGNILEAAERMSTEERVRIAHLVSAASEPEVAADLLSELHCRWPDAQLTGAWRDLSLRDGEIVFARLPRVERAEVRRQMLIGWLADGVSADTAERALSEVIDTDPDPAVRAQALLTLGQVDHPDARQRLAEESRRTGSPLWETHLSAAIRNALSHAHDRWVHQIAIPYARRRIADSREPEEERRRWERALQRTHPDAVDALVGP